MPQLTGADGTAVSAAFFSDTAQRHPLGTRAHDLIGREFVYVKAGSGANLVVGNAIQAPAQNTNHDQLTPSAAAIGATSITLVPDAALTAQDYADGLAVIDTTPGLGYAYRITSHPAWASGAGIAIQLAPGDEVQVALDTNSRVTLVRNPYNAVIQCPVTTATNICIGGCIFLIVLSQFGWIQAHGLGAALIDGTPGVGQPVTNVASAAGALAVHSAELPEVALMSVTGVTGKVLPVFWLL